MFTGTVTKTNQENKRLIYENYTYRFDREKHGLKKVEMYEKACKAFVRTDAECKSVVLLNMEHNHTTDEHQVVKQLIRTSVLLPPPRGEQGQRCYASANGRGK